MTMDTGLHSRRRYFICQGTSHIPLNVMHNATGADVVFAKDFENGVLYALYFKSKNHKKPSTVEKSILRLDDMLMAKNKTSTTYFVSLTADGKTKSFSGRDRHEDFHFREIFDVLAPKLDGGKRYRLSEGVTAWSLFDSENAYSAPEFDVVKKRRLMTASGAAGDDDPEALQRFEEFEASVLDALADVSQNYQKQRYEELLEAETDLSNGVPPRKGTFYVTVSLAVLRGRKYIPKMGATRRSNPMARLKELSQSVPYAFELVYAIATFTPFRLEAEIHRHFDSRRIRERKGACTEFFDISLEEIGEYLKTKYPGEVIDGGFVAEK